MTPTSEPTSGKAATAGGRRGGRWYLWFGLGTMAILTSYGLVYFLLRNYRAIDPVSVIFYGPQNDWYCAHLYGAGEDRAAFIRKAHALPRESLFDSMTGIYEEADKTKFMFTLLFVPAELLECKMRNAFR